MRADWLNVKSRSEGGCHGIFNPCLLSLQPKKGKKKRENSTSPQCDPLLSDSSWSRQTSRSRLEVRKVFQEPREFLSCGSELKRTRAKLWNAFAGLSRVSLVADDTVEGAGRIRRPASF